MSPVMWGLALTAGGFAFGYLVAVSGQRRETMTEYAPIAKVRLQAVPRRLYGLWCLGDVEDGWGCPIPGLEAEELRRGIEELLARGSVDHADFQALLDRVPARDSLAWLELRDGLEDR